MSISQVISLAKEYCLLGLVAALLLTVLILAGYFILYKRILKGKGRIKVSSLLWMTVFICYLTIIAGATFMSRGTFWGRGNISPLFASYKSAMTGFSARAWRFILLNILMFVPFGFLLPSGIPWFRKFWRTYLCGFLFTLGIETMQCILGRGIFDLDDIFNNMIGTMTGYGFYAIVRCFFVHIRKEKNEKNEKISGRYTIALQLPLILFCCSLTFIFVSYAMQELGNLSDTCMSIEESDSAIYSVNEQDTSNGSIDESKDLTCPVYKVKKYNQEETKQIADTFFEIAGDTIDQESTIYYDDTIIYRGMNNTSLWIDYLGGTIVYNESSTQDDAIDNPVTDATEDTIKEMLQLYGIVIPDGAVFTNVMDGSYTFTVKEAVADNKMYDGSLTCQPDDQGKMKYIRGYIKCYDYYKDFVVISAKAAYQRVQEYDFRDYTEKDIPVISIEHECIEYRSDTKGYFQPVYTYIIRLDDELFELSIPAVG